ncbi:MAG: hypothetical protein KY475_17390 [Planctomycetes bacterium]|nr:hypothetical protein [Planctomycetota bacterium]
MPSVLTILLAAAVLTQSPGFREFGRLSDPDIQEASALEASRRFPGVFWTVPDSGNPPHLIAIDRTGRVLAKYHVSEAVNLDWECLALDEAGNLYICDVGNNVINGHSRLHQRWVYVVREPDPRAPSDDEAAGDGLRKLAVERTIFVRYPDRPFDIEAAFAWGRQVYFISKTRDHAAIYRLPTSDAEGPVRLEKVAELPGLDRATGAALSPDGRRLAVCTYHDVWLYPATAADGFALKRRRPTHRLPYEARGVEACAWDGKDLVLLSEAGRIYRLRCE